MEADLESTKGPFFQLESEFDPVVIAARRSSLSPAHYIEERAQTVATDELPLLSHSAQKEIVIMALGKTGDGKSSLLNDMLGKQVFKHRRAVQSQTAEVQEASGFWAPLDAHTHKVSNFGCNIRVFDTPGFGDSQLRDSQFLPTIQSKIRELAAVDNVGIHCLFLVSKVTTSVDSLMANLRTLRDLLRPSETFWENVILVFTHADASNINRYRNNKVVLKTKVSVSIKEEFGISHELPMVFISTQAYMCSFLKGLGECDCDRKSRYNADCRRRLYEQVWLRRDKPFHFVDIIVDTN